MGFGTLFFGYFLLLNLAYYGFTDIIAALIMLLALYNLRSVNRYFNIGIAAASVFALVGAVEFVEAVAGFAGFNLSFLLYYTAPSRYLMMGFITILILMGIEDVSREVGLEESARRASHMAIPAYFIYAIGAISEFPFIANLIPPVAMRIIYTVILFTVFIYTILMLTVIYSAYMKICMPNDVNHDIKDKPSKFGIVNQMRKHKEEKDREYAEYKLQKYRKRAEKQRNKKK